MLVKFKTKEGTPIEVDSGDLLLAGKDVLLKDTLLTWKIDEPALNYISSAKAHEGMRRVRSDDECGWTYAKPDFYTGIDAIYVEKDDNSRVVWSFNHVKFIPYEMEEQK